MLESSIAHLTGRIEDLEQLLKDHKGTGDRTGGSAGETRPPLYERLKNVHRSVCFDQVDQHFSVAEDALLMATPLLLDSYRAEAMAAGDVAESLHVAVVPPRLAMCAIDSDALAVPPSAIAEFTDNLASLRAAATALDSAEVRPLAATAAPAAAAVEQRCLLLDQINDMETQAHAAFATLADAIDSFNLVRGAGALAPAHLAPQRLYVYSLSTPHTPPSPQRVALLEQLYARAAAIAVSNSGAVGPGPVGSTDPTVNPNDPTASTDAAGGGSKGAEGERVEEEVPLRTSKQRGVDGRLAKFASRRPGGF